MSEDLSNMIVNKALLEQLAEDAKLKKAQADQEEREIHEAVVGFTPDEIFDFLESYVESTEVVMEGLNLANQLTEGCAISYCALERLRTGAYRTLCWLDNQFELKKHGEVEDNMPIVLGSEEL